MDYIIIYIHIRFQLVWHSVPERIWIKGSYLSQWLPQGERGHPKESKSRWIEILHGGSQFTLWFLKIKIFLNFSDHSEIFFCFTIHKKLNKTCSLDNFFLFLKKKVVSQKKIIFLFSHKDTYLAFSFLFPSVLLSCYHHLKAKNGMYFWPSIFEHFRMVWWDTL